MSAEAKGYWIVAALVSDPVRFGEYTAVAGPVMGRAGARVLAMGQAFEVVEGTTYVHPHHERLRRRQPPPTIEELAQ